MERLGLCTTAEDAEPHVVVEEDGDESTEAIKRFNEHVKADERVECLMLTVCEGMTLIRRR